MADTRQNIRRVQSSTKTSLSNEISSKMLGQERETKKLGFFSTSSSAGDPDSMDWYTPDGGDAEFNTVTINVPVSGNIKADANGTLIVDNNLEADFQFVDFDPQTIPPAYQEGRAWYDDNKKAVSYYNEEADVTVNLGQEVLFRVENQTAAIITNGTIIAPDITTIITPADAYEKDKSRFIAVATHDIGIGESGYATRLGQVGGLDTSMYVAGQTLYLGQNGAFSTTAPDNGGYAIVVAVVDVVHATEGIITVDPHLTELTVEVTDTNGFSTTEKANTTLSVVEGTRTFTITPTTTHFHFYELGDKKEIVGADSVTWTDVEGEHWFYYQDGVLTHKYNPSIPERIAVILNYAFVAAIYWDATNKVVVGDIQEERHGIGMSPTSHLYNHLTRGAQFVAGLGIGDVVADASSPTDTAVQFSVAAGTYFDEDITHNCDAVDATTGCPVLYNEGSTTNVREGNLAGFKFLTGATGIIEYNEWTGTTWQRTELSSNKFVLYHVWGFNGVDVNTITMMGQAEYGSITEAEEAAGTEIANLITQLPSAEMVPLATLVFEHKSTYTSTGKARIRVVDGQDFIDWRTTELKEGTPPSSHANLTNVELAGAGVAQGHINDQAQTIAGVKTFSSSPSIPSGTLSGDAVNKGQLDLKADSTSLSSHTGDATIHFSEGSINHDNILNNGTNTHTQIDSHISNTSNPHAVTKSDVGLANVDNTTDLNKPISTATKEYVDNLVQGISWQEPVKDRYDPTTSLPVAPVTGDRYIATATANGWTINNIYEYNGATWDGTIATEGFAVYVKDEDIQYSFNGTSWVTLASTNTHNNLAGLELAGTGVTYGHINDQAQTIAGVKTFSSSPSIPSGTLSGDAVNKGQLDGKGVSSDSTLSGDGTSASVLSVTNPLPTTVAFVNNLTELEDALLDGNVHTIWLTSFISVPGTSSLTYNSWKYIYGDWIEFQSGSSLTSGTGNSIFFHNYYLDIIGSVTFDVSNSIKVERLAGTTTPSVTMTSGTFYYERFFDGTMPTGSLIQDFWFNTNKTNTLTKSIYLENPTDADFIPLWHLSQDITITEVTYEASGTTPSANFNLVHSGDSSKLWTLDKSATTTIQSSTSFDDSDCSINEYVFLDMGTITGTVDAIAITIAYEPNSGVL